jgi:hypothetical protein
MGRRGLRDRAWEGYAGLPEPVQRQTDKVVRAGAKVAKRLRPLREDTRRRGEAWVKKHGFGLGRKKRK